MGDPVGQHISSKSKSTAIDLDQAPRCYLCCVRRTRIRLGCRIRVCEFEFQGFDRL